MDDEMDEGGEIMDMDMGPDDDDSAEVSSSVSTKKLLGSGKTTDKSKSSSDPENRSSFVSAPKTSDKGTAGVPIVSGQKSDAPGQGVGLFVQSWDDIEDYFEGRGLMCEEVGGAAMPSKKCTTHAAGACGCGGEVGGGGGGKAKEEPTEEEAEEAAKIWEGLDTVKQTASVHITRSQGGAPSVRVSTVVGPGEFYCATCGERRAFGKTQSGDLRARAVTGGHPEWVWGGWLACEACGLRQRSNCSASLERSPHLPKGGRALLAASVANRVDVESFTNVNHEEYLLEVMGCSRPTDLRDFWEKRLKEEEAVGAFESFRGSLVGLLGSSSTSAPRSFVGHVVVSWWSRSRDNRPVVVIAIVYAGRDHHETIFSWWSSDAIGGLPPSLPRDECPVVVIRCNSRAGRLSRGRDHHGAIASWS